MEQLSDTHSDRVSRRKTTGSAPHQTRTLVLRLMRDAHGIWHAALSEPSSADAWHATCEGLGSIWPAVLNRLSCAEVQDTPEH